MNTNYKIKSVNEIRKTIRDFKNKGDKVVLCMGTFDLLHKGHLYLFQGAKKEANILIVGVDADKNVKHFKGEKRPFNDQSARMFIISNLEIVDYVFPVPEIIELERTREHFKKLFIKLKPDFVASNYKTSTNAKYQKLDAEYIGAKFIDVEKIYKKDTTYILNKINKSK